MLKGKVIGFVGAGAMTEALLRGMLQSGTVEPQNIMVSNRSNPGRLEELAATWGVAAGDKETIAKKADIVFLSVKPKDLAGVLNEIGQSLRADQLIISVAAGIPTSFIEGFCANEVPVIRAMPNTSCTVLASATAITRGRYAVESAEQIAVKLFSSVGIVECVEENLLDVVTGLSGSGPAYVYLMVEALQQAGQELGMSPEMALSLAKQTVFGAAKMLLETGENPAVLRKAVSSPNGTTVAGLQALSANGFPEAVRTAVAAASKRSKEMGLEYTGGAVSGSGK